MIITDGYDMGLVSSYITHEEIKKILIDIHIDRDSADPLWMEMVVPIREIEY